MSAMWWILTMSGAVVIGAIGARLGWARHVRTRKEWAAVGMNYGAAWPSAVSVGISFGLVGFTLGNLAAQWWF